MSAIPLTIMLVAGEPSGDQLGAELMEGLHAVAAAEGRALRIIGIGGVAMTAAGLDSLFPLDATSVMGLREVVPRIPEILRRVRRAVEYALEQCPDVVVLIDSPDFTHRIAKELKRRDRGMRTINYPPPQVWASRAYRARRMAEYMDAILAILPFEAPFFERYGIETHFIGYPVVERRARMKGGAEFRRRHGIAADAKLLAVLPGSRRNEIRLILPVLKETVRRLAPQIPGLSCVLPVVAHVAALVREGTKDWPVTLHLVEGEDEKFSGFDAADVAIAASGTVTSELAMARVPMVVGYRTGWLTYTLALPLMNVKYITLLNLVLNREAIPEYLQTRCTPEALAAAALPLFSDSPQRAQQLADIEEALAALGENAESPSLRAARVVMELAARSA